MSPTLNAEAIAALCLHTGPNGLAVQIPQTTHRLNLVNHWEISEGQKILELGCGQGDTTAILATAVGETGKVVALDPAPLDYGAPFTLRQAQAHLSASPVGNQIQFVQADTLAYLGASTEMFDAVVLSHCIWYFASPRLFNQTLHLLRKRAKKLVIAEYNLTASRVSASPHVIAALSQASLECRKPSSDSNVRTVLAPARLAESAIAAGWVLKKEEVVLTPEGMLDGQWEIGSVLSKHFRDEVDEFVRDEREKAVVVALIDSTRASKERLNGEALTTMDVWSAVFETEFLS